MSGTRKITVSAAVAALYVALTLVSSLMGLSGGVVQVRLSEALCVLPVFTPYAIPGLFLGCALANLITGCVLWDIIFGSFTTLLASVAAYLIRGFMRQRGDVPDMRRDRLYLAGLPAVVFNAASVPLILRYAYGVPGPLWYMVLTVAAGETISAGALGAFLTLALRKRPMIFK